MSTNFNVYLVPNEMCRRVGVAATFISTNQLGVFPSQLVKQNTSNAPSPYSTDTEAKVFQFRPEIILYHSTLRRLLNESGGIFLDLQIQATKTISQEQKIRFSIQYRSVIRACLENLKEELMQSTCVDKDTLHNYITIFYSVECLWHLCEILFLQECVGGQMIGTRLLSWVRFHIPKYERRASKLLNMFTNLGIENEEDYWPTVIGCLLQGRVYEVQLLLGMHSNATTYPFRSAMAVLKNMPTYETFAQEGISVTQFNLRRKHWLIETQTKIDSHEYASEKNLLFIMRLVVGEEIAWNEVRKNCEVWYELLAGWIFYTDPTLKTVELGKYAQKCITRMKVPIKQIDYVMLAAMHKDIDFINQIQNMNDNGWFVTHLIDLLYHCGLLETWQTQETSAEKLRETFIVEYGTILMEHNSLWQLGLSYLDHCSIRGKETMKLLLPRLASTETKAVKIIREANKRKFYDIATTIAKVQFNYYVQHNRYGNAIIWALKARDPERITFIVNKTLKHYKKTFKLLHEDVFRNLGPCMLASDSLIFLAKYYEYSANMKEEEYSPAANALVALMGSKFTPKFFCDVMLSETLRLLEKNAACIDANSAIIIMNYLDEYATDVAYVQMSQMIRMALSRRLANVLTQNKPRKKL